LSPLSSASDRCFILVKALPHRSSSYYETVCCAGIGADGKWRRQYPVPFRVLDDNQKFGRWQWIAYDYTVPKNDTRWESQKVIPESLQIIGEVKPRERARFLNPLIRESLSEARERGESLTLVRPSSFRLSAKRKTEAELSDERQKHAVLANQISMFGQQVKPLEPCPYLFRAHWKDQEGKSHTHVCDDWETSTAFFVRRKSHDEQGAISSLKSTFEEEYMSRGMAMAFSTHSRRPDQWLLVGLIRLDHSDQGDLLLG